MSVLREFREFAARGSVIDLAVGVIIGAAFGRIVASLVSDVLMPPIGLLMGGINFSDLFVTLDGGAYATLAAAREASAPVIAYGQFVNTMIEFLIVAAAIFLLVRQINRLKTPEPAPPVDDRRDCPFCISRIPGQATRCPYCTATVNVAV
jgi:large conductance mechanosensitive channel